MFLQSVLVSIIKKYQNYSSIIFHEVLVMKNTAGNILPENYILAVLSPEERLDAACTVAKQAFKKTKLTMKDIDAAVKSIRSRNVREKK